MYDDVLTFFPPNEKTVKINKIEKTIILKPPSEELMKKFFSDVVLEFSSFETLSGFYRQKEGLSMGSKISLHVFAYKGGGWEEGWKNDSRNLFLFYHSGILVVQLIVMIPFRSSDGQ